MENNKRTRNNWFYTAQLIVDSLIVAISYLVGYFIQRPSIFQNQLLDLIYFGGAILIVSIIVLSKLKVHLCGRLLYWQTIFNLLIALVVIAIFSIFIGFAFNTIGIWRRTLLYAGLIQVAILALIKLLVIFIHKKAFKPIPLVLFGNEHDEIEKLINDIQVSYTHLYTIKKIIIEGEVEFKKHIDLDSEVLICATCSSSFKTKVSGACILPDIKFYIIPTTNEILINSGKARCIEDLLVYDLFTKISVGDSILKRIFDIVVSVIGIVITLPIMVVAACIIFFQDGANPFYTQKRLGKNEKEFTMIKLRSMIIDAEKASGPVLAHQNDERITRFGTFIRKTRIDELPQLFNVFVGSMSIVGPRPERRVLADEQQKTLPEFRYRTLVKPGLTGYAQVNGKYSTSLPDKLKMDLYYIYNYGFALDLYLVVNTLRVVFMPSVSEGVKFIKDPNAQCDINKMLMELGFECIERNVYIGKLN